METIGISAVYYFECIIQYCEETSQNLYGRIENRESIAFYKLIIVKTFFLSLCG